MKALCLFLALLSSCALPAGQPITIPLQDAEILIGFARNARSFDTDGDGELRDQEAWAFLTWFSLQVYGTWGIPTSPVEPTILPSS
jgi:hypothetical protein